MRFIRERIGTTRRGGGRGAYGEILVGLTTVAVVAIFIPFVLGRKSQRRGPMNRHPGGVGRNLRGWIIIESEDIFIIAVLQRALELGINFFDTARAYEGGNNERFLKAALGARRKEVVLSTRSYAENAKELAADLDSSLEALGISQLDVWYIGNKNDPAEVTDEMLDVQRKAQEAGKVRFRALSTHVPSLMMELILQRGKFDVVQVPYNFAIGTRRDPMNIRHGPRHVADAARRRGCRRRRDEGHGRRLRRPQAERPALRHVPEAWRPRRGGGRSATRAADDERAHGRRRAARGERTGHGAELLAGGRAGPARGPRRRDLAPLLPDVRRVRGRLPERRRRGGPRPLR